MDPKDKNPKPENPEEDEPQETPDTDDATGGDEDGGNEGGETPRFTQEQVDAIVKDRLDRAAKKQEKDKADAERKAREDEAKKRGDLETQLEIGQEQIKELTGQVADMETLQRRVEALESLLQQIYEGRVKALTEEGQKAVNSLPESLPLEERLKWLDENAETFLKAASSAAGGVPPSPAGKKPTRQPADDERRKKSASVRNYW